MSTTIYIHEFKALLKSVIAWSLAVAGLFAIYLSLFPSFAKDAALIEDAMTNFPEELLTAFGMNGLNLATVLGYLSFVFLFVQLCLAIQAAGYGFSLVSVEERELTADFLLTKPVTRTRILTSKLLAALTALTITNLVAWVSCLGLLRIFAADYAYETRPLLLILGSIVFFQLFFLAVGLVISLLVKRIRNVVPYAMGLAFGMYVLSVFSDMLGESVLEKITPFKHFNPSDIIRTDSYNFSLVWISIAVIILALSGSYYLYLRRDIPSVA
jgi:ABC-2 type transport system permease protein